jgi:hypothetical protein
VIVEVPVEVAVPVMVMVVPGAMGELSNMVTVPVGAGIAGFVTVTVVCA